jgi:Lon protease-like protein
VARTRTIPLFPLGTVLYPSAVLPLHIFEQRYRDLVRDLSERPHDEREFGVIAIREGHEVGTDAANALHVVGTIASMRGIDPLPDGRFDIVSLGTDRFRLIDINNDSASYLTATIELLDDAPGGTPAAITALQQDIRLLAARYHEYARVPSAPAVVADEPTTFTWEVAEGLILDDTEQQKILASETLADRMRLLRSYLRRECGLLETLPSLPAASLLTNRFSIN